MKIVLDANIWVSYAIGKRLDELKYVLLDPKISIYSCDELIIEFLEVSLRPNLQKYISADRLDFVFEQLWNYTKRVSVPVPLKIAGDPGDDYLLQVCVDNEIEFLITGDKLLLGIKNYVNTEIVTYSGFISLCVKK